MLCGGYSSVGLERLIVVQEVEGSNPSSRPITFPHQIQLTRYFRLDRVQKLPHFSLAKDLFLQVLCDHHLAIKPDDLICDEVFLLIQSFFEESQHNFLSFVDIHVPLKLPVIISSQFKRRDSDPYPQSSKSLPRPYL